jgi:hypothetical protein
VTDKFGLLLCLSAVVLMASVLLVGAKQWIETGSGTVNGQITGDYMFYGGEYYNGQGPPVPGNAKISMGLRGEMAADMYRYMGKAAQLKPDSDCGDFERREKGQLSCKRNKKTGATYCHVHFNLVTGKADLMLGC